MSIRTRIARGEGPFWGTLKKAARSLMGFHIPVPPAARPIVGIAYRLHVAGRDALGWALRFFWYEPLFRSRCESIGEGFRMEQLPYMAGVGRIVIGSRVWLSGKSLFEFSNRSRARPELRLGDHSFVGHGCRFHIADAVRIGRHCLIAGGVSVFDCDGHPLDAAGRRNGLPTPPEGIAPVTVGDDVWIGNGATILKGVTIGDRAVVGAGSVVVRDVPPDAVVAGNPARVVKRLTAPEMDASPMSERHPGEANGSAAARPWEPAR